MKKKQHPNLLKMESKSLINAAIITDIINPRAPARKKSWQNLNNNERSIASSKHFGSRKNSKIMAANQQLDGNLGASPVNNQGMWNKLIS